MLVVGGSASSSPLQSECITQRITPQPVIRTMSSENNPQQQQRRTTTVHPITLIRPNKMHCIPNKVLESEMFPMIADENIDPISLNKKITYGFTETLSKMDESMMRMVQMKQRMQTMQRRQTQYMVGFKKQLIEKSIRQHENRNTHIEYKVKACQNRQRSWQHRKNQYDQQQLERQLVKEIMQEDYLNQQQEFWNKREALTEGIQASRPSTQDLRNTEHIPSSLELNHFKNNIHKRSSQFITQTDEFVEIQGYNPTIKTPLLQSENPLTRSSQKFGMNPTSRPQTTTSANSEYSRNQKIRSVSQSTQQLQDPSDENNNLLQQFQKDLFKVIKSQDSITKQIILDSINSNHTKRSTTGTAGFLRSRTITQFQQDDKKHERKFTARPSTVEQTSELNSLNAKRQNLKFISDKRRSKCLDNVLQNQIQQLEKDENMIGKERKRQLASLVQRQVSTNTNLSSNLKLKFNFPSTQSNTLHTSGRDSTNSYYQIGQV